MKGYIVRGRAPGSWYLRVDLPADADGKRRQRRETVDGNKAKAERRLRALLSEIETGAHVDGGRAPCAVLFTSWLADAKRSVGFKTAERYESIVRCHLVPTLGSLRAEQLKPFHISDALTTWADGPRHDRKKGKLTPRSVKHIFNTLKTALRWGVGAGFLVRNPIDAVKAPKVSRREMHALDPAGVRALVDAARGSDLEQLIIVAVGTGARRGELAGLRWRDVKLETGQVTIRRGLEEIAEERLEKETKTAQSERTLAVSGVVLDALRAQRTAQNERRLRLGLGRDDDAVVFDRAADGTPYKLGAMSVNFAALVERAKLPHVCLQDLRHTFATLSLLAGVDLKTVSFALGHSTITLTANTYGHVLESMKRQHADQLGAVLDEALGRVKKTC